MGIIKVTKTYPDGTVETKEIDLDKESKKDDSKGKSPTKRKTVRSTRKKDEKSGE